MPADVNYEPGGPDPPNVTRAPAEPARSRLRAQEAAIGERGPIPERSDQRVRRNTTEYGTIDKIATVGTVDIPELGLEDAHEIVQDLWDSHRESAQTKYFEPSDWQMLRVQLYFLDDLMKAPKKSAMMLSTLNSALSELLVSEGARRRVRIEVERTQKEAEIFDLGNFAREKLSAPHQ